MPEAKVGSHAHDLHGSVLVKDLARATGVSEVDAVKVLEHLGVVRLVEQAVRITGKVPAVSDLRVAFKLGGSTIVV